MIVTSGELAAWPHSLSTSVTRQCRFIELAYRELQFGEKLGKSGDSWVLLSCERAGGGIWFVGNRGGMQIDLDVVR
jgi:hypothetical protein